MVDAYRRGVRGGSSRGTGVRVESPAKGRSESKWRVARGKRKRDREEKKD